MKFDPITVKLKNGKEIVIRQCLVEDAENLLTTVRTYMNDSKFYALTKEEFTITIPQEEKWIQSFIDNTNSLLLVAVYENKIIGNLDLTAHNRMKLNHTAIIGMSLLEEWRGFGLGFELLNAVINWSKNKSKLTRLWLQVFGDNTNAIALYKKVGFIEEGRQKNFIKTEDGGFDDNVIMGLQLN